MSVWEKYDKDQRNTYTDFLQMYGALSAMFNQKSSETGAPYLDSKFQETIYARSFGAEAVDIGNTPHDIKSVFSGQNVGIGIKTWLNSSPSYQKVMQLKKDKSEIDAVAVTGVDADLAYKISEIKNSRLQTDYDRLGLHESDNIYHYVTRDHGKMVLQETAYPKVELSYLGDFVRNGDKSFEWSDGLKRYKYTFGDSQVWMLFGSQKTDHTILSEVKIDILEDPFDFLRNAFKEKHKLWVPGITISEKSDLIYLPLYSYSEQRVTEKGGLNVWNAAGKVLNGGRPEAEVYIPVPTIFNKKYPFWFSDTVDTRDYKAFATEVEAKQAVENEYVRGKKDGSGKPLKAPKLSKSISFTLRLPNGDKYPALFGQAGFKAVQTNPQSALGNWLLYDVLGLEPQELVTKELLENKGFDSVQLWHPNPKDKSLVYIDFAPVGSFERFIHGESTDNSIEEDETVIHTFVNN